MSKTKGTVTRTGKGQYSYYVTLDTRDGYYFNTKFEPTCKKGDVVGIEFEDKGKRGNIKKLVVLEEGPEQPKDDFSEGGAPSTGGGGGSRQDSIIWQHSQEMAIRLVDILATAAAIKLPKNAEARGVTLEALVAAKTVELFNDATDPRNSPPFRENEEIREDYKETQDDNDPAPPKEDEDGDDEWGDWD